MVFSRLKKIIILFSFIVSFSGLKASDAYKTENFYKVSKNVFSAPEEKYYVTGHSFAIDPNLAFFLETQNPEFSVNFISTTGKRKAKFFKAKINTIGFKIEATIKIDAIMLVNTDDKFYSAKKIHLGVGIDSNLAAGLGIGLTYVPFINVPGGMLIISYLPIGIVAPSISLVTGGTLTPVDY